MVAPLLVGPGGRVVGMMLADGVRPPRSSPSQSFARREAVSRATMQRGYAATPAAGGEPWVSGQNVGLGLGGRRTIAAQRLRRSAIPRQAKIAAASRRAGWHRSLAGGGHHSMIAGASRFGMRRTIAPQGSPAQDSPPKLGMSRRARMRGASWACDAGLALTAGAAFSKSNCSTYSTRGVALGDHAVPLAVLLRGSLLISGVPVEEHCGLTCEYRCRSADMALQRSGRIDVFLLWCGTHFAVVCIVTP